MEPTKEQLMELYTDRRLPASKIAETLGVSVARVYRLLEEHGIERRPPGSAPLEMPPSEFAEEMANFEADRRCKAVRDDGNRCNNWAVKENHYCRIHLFADKGRLSSDAFPNALDWTLCRRRIDAKPFSLDRHPYLEEIYKDNSKYIVIQKGTQLGVSEFALNRSLWFCETGRGNVIYTLPTMSDCSDFSKMRLGPIMGENEWESDFDGREIDNVKMKQIGNRFLILKGSFDARHAISIPSDMNIHDEVDFSKTGIINQYRARLGHSVFAWQLFLSTPTLPEAGINQLFLETDQRHWYVACPSCGKEHRLCCGFPDLVIEQEYRCPECKTVLDRTKGRWIANFPEREKRGYHISRLMAPWVSADDLLAAKKSYQRVKDFYNLELGLPYAGEDMPLDMKTLNECGDERINLHVRDEGCTAGVDQGNEVHVVVSKTVGGNKKQVVWVEKIPIDLAYQMLEQYMDQFKIHTLVIDAMPNTASARQLALKFPGRIFLCYYKDGMVDPIKWDFANHTVLANRTETLQKMCQRFHSHEVVLPVHEKMSEYKKHLTNLVTVIEENGFTGEKIMKFTKTGDDHFAHANNYDDIAQARGMRARVIVHRLDLEEKKKAEDEKPKEGLEYEIEQIPEKVLMDFRKQTFTLGKNIVEFSLEDQTYHKKMCELWEKYGHPEVLKVLGKKLNRIVFESWAERSRRSGGSSLRDIF
jgi:transposase-like protein